MKDVQLKQNHILYPKSVSDLEKCLKNAIILSNIYK